THTAGAMQVMVMSLLLAHMVALLIGKIAFDEQFACKVVISCQLRHAVSTAITTVAAGSPCMYSMTTLCHSAAFLPLVYAKGQLTCANQLWYLIRYGSACLCSSSVARHWRKHQARFHSRACLLPPQSIAG